MVIKLTLGIEKNLIYNCCKIVSNKNEEELFKFKYNATQIRSNAHNLTLWVVEKAPYINSLLS